MLCIPCGGQAIGDGEPRRMRRLREATCERCGAKMLTLEGTVVGEGHAVLARLARFGLVSGGKPLLQPKRGSR